MPETLGYHVVKTTFGTWLPGDSRGYWNAHKFFDAGDSRKELRARQRMENQPTKLTDAMIQAVIESVGECIACSNGGLKVMAAAIEPTHIHLLIPYSPRDIEIAAKWLADQTTKAVHRRTAHTGPVWSKNNWIRHIFDSENWANALVYIDQHNIRAGRGTRPFPFLCDIEI